MLVLLLLKKVLYVHTGELQKQPYDFPPLTLLTNRWSHLVHAQSLCPFCSNQCYLSFKFCLPEAQACSGQVLYDWSMSCLSNSLLVGFWVGSHWLGVIDAGGGKGLMFDLCAPTFPLFLVSR